MTKAQVDKKPSPLINSVVKLCVRLSRAVPANITFILVGSAAGVCWIVLMRALVGFPLLTVKNTSILWVLIGVSPLIALGKEWRFKYLFAAVFMSGAAGLFLLLGNYVACSLDMPVCADRAGGAKIWVPIACYFAYLLIGVWGIWIRGLRNRDRRGKSVDMAATVQNRIDELSRKSFAELSTLPEEARERIVDNGKSSTLTIWHDPLGSGEHRIVVQMYRPGFLGIGRMFAEGFVVGSDGGRRPLSIGEWAPFS
jgi:hypothetical protein